jgi:hypothetical protein
MEEIFNNLTELEKKIVDYVCSAKTVRMSDILNYIKGYSSEYMQNRVRDLVIKEVLITHQNPIVPEWTYELSYFYKSYKNLL